MTRDEISWGFHTPRRTSDVWDETQKSEVINDCDDGGFGSLAAIGARIPDDRFALQSSYARSHHQIDCC